MSRPGNSYAGASVGARYRKHREKAAINERKNDETSTDGLKSFAMSEGYRIHQRLRFGEFILDTDRAALQRDGEEVKLRPKSFEVLRYLAEHPGVLVTRDELLDTLWQGTVVTEDAVTQCLIDVRRAIGDTSQQMIRTVPRRGYIFELPVEEVAGEPAPVSRAKADETSRSLRVGVPAVAVFLVGAALLFWVLNREFLAGPEIAPGATTATYALAVLPFSDMSADQDQRHFADGMSEEILNLLAQRRVLKVIARTSSFSYRGQEGQLAKIAEELGVTHVLEGSVRKGGEQLRISVQLVDANTSEYVWTDSYDRGLSGANILAIQSDIATEVAESLNAELSDEQRATRARALTRNVDALDAYFEARQLMETRYPAKLSQALGLLQQAVALDPNFPLAYVAIADTYRLLNAYGDISAREADALGLQAVQTALTLNDELGEAYATLGNLIWVTGDHEGAERAFRRAIELAPNYAPAYQWYGEYLARFGGAPEKGVSYTKMAVALDPKSAIINTDHAEALASAGRVDEAIAQFEAAIAIDPSMIPAYTGKAMALHRTMGRTAEAIPIFRQAREIAEDAPNPSLYLALAYLDLNDVDTATGYIDEVLDVAPDHTHAVAIAMEAQMQQGLTELSWRSAERVLQDWPRHGLSHLYLRDRFLEAQDIDGAVAHYRQYFPELFVRGAETVDAENFDVAIDLAHALMLAGRQAHAEDLLTEAWQRLSAQPRLTYGPYRIADVRIHAIRGNTDAALGALREAVASGWRNRWWYPMERDLALLGLRDQPEFEEIYAILRAGIDEQRKRLGIGL